MTAFNFSDTSCFHSEDVTPIQTLGLYQSIIKTYVFVKERFTGGKLPGSYEGPSRGKKGKRIP